MSLYLAIADDFHFLNNNGYLSQRNIPHEGQTQAFFVLKTTVNCNCK